MTFVTTCDQFPVVSAMIRSLLMSMVGEEGVSTTDELTVGVMEFVGEEPLVRMRASTAALACAVASESVTGSMEWACPALLPASFLLQEATLEAKSSGPRFLGFVESPGDGKIIVGVEAAMESAVSPAVGLGRIKGFPSGDCEDATPTTHKDEAKDIIKETSEKYKLWKPWFSSKLPNRRRTYIRSDTKETPVGPLRRQKQPVDRILRSWSKVFE